jgi:hypothetical protein
MKQENDQLRADLEKLKQRLREEITRTMAGVRLDLNLEKGESWAGNYDGISLGVRLMRYSRSDTRWGVSTRAQDQRGGHSDRVGDCRIEDTDRAGEGNPIHPWDPVFIIFR